MDKEFKKEKIKLILIEPDEHLGYLLSEFFYQQNFVTYISENFIHLTNIINSHNPDIIIVDDSQNLETYKLSNIYLPIILLTTRGLKNDRMRVHKLGFDAYMLKPFDPDELIAIISNLIYKKRNIKGLQFIKHRVKNLNLKLKCRETTFSYINLTVKEKEVFRFIQDGLTNKQISNIMGITQRSVEKYITKIFEKLKIQNRIQLLAYFS